MEELSVLRAEVDIRRRQRYDDAIHCGIGHQELGPAIDETKGPSPGRRRRSKKTCRRYAPHVGGQH